ncbi:Uncharacterized conserved protein, DUF58 family, contains vWF domain [Parafrankia irregularis]|uniref:Uncharacterized conserved protein, DUF58 family, contains vWF domain n=1 Tax=Parafrankia irregularis TaxID=795642 RepID=A0A0S4R1A2_9ACTN|nr:MULTISPECIES: DUF58 domain-containing protein [Parafrankia]MBE3202295.1 DUF58 domain-containing protein [Parafrankia sp. CH37]CUU61231.1 Uncharacterized conserved protein, DUF58 family, contains vWF domain [Parafrankia irregularis]
MTSAGIWVAALSVVLGAAGSALRYPGLVGLAAGFGMALVVAVLAVAGRDGLAVTLHSHASVTRDDLVTVTATAQNRRRRVRPGGRLDVPNGLAPIVLPVQRLRPGRMVTVSTRIVATRRGVWGLGPAVSVRRDPLGLLARTRLVGEQTTLVVRPRRYEIEPLAWSHHQRSDGSARSLPRPGLAEFETLREYVPGDDTRRVHWPSSARTGTLQVRTFVDPTTAAALVLLDTRRLAYTEGAAGDAAFEDAVEVAASVAHAYAGHRLPVRLRTTGGLAWPVGGSTGREEDLLDQLAALCVQEPRPGDAAGSSDPTGLADALRALRRGDAQKTSALLVVVTGVRAYEAPMVAGGHRTGPVILIRTGAARPDARLEPGDGGGDPVATISLDRAADLPDLWRRLDELTSGRMR